MAPKLENQLVKSPSSTNRTNQNLSVRIPSELNHNVNNNFNPQIPTEIVEEDKTPNNDVSGTCDKVSNSQMKTYAHL